ncbi:MAG: exosortase/archaeosortase family protein [Candidatus Aenigmarchaeota archaeon]|nr:exosortase/archaeosortase family protein [Candidatus Aenigmarchaeota archaeon]
MVLKVPENEKLVRLLLFVVRLILLSVPLYLVIVLGISMLPLQQAVAAHSEWLISASGFDVSSMGLVLVCGPGEPFTFYIGEDCTGWKSMMLLFALMFATMEAGYRRKLLGLAVGIPLIYAANLLRILAVVFTESLYGYDTAMFVHDWLWQLGLLAVVLVIWLCWLKWDRLTAKLRKHIIALREK